MLYSHHIDACFEDRLGEEGVSHQHIDRLLKRLMPMQTALRDGKDDDAKPLLAVPARGNDLPELLTLAARIRERFRYLVVAGAGGAGLSGKILSMMKPSLDGPTLYFLDNIDPHAIDDCLNAIECEETCFLIVSKSGETVETLSQFYLMLERVKSRLGEKAPGAHFIIITSPGNSPLRQSAEQYGIPVLNHESDIGGRFSALTNVGLLPAAIAGLDIAALRRGAQTVIASLKSDEPCAPAIGAALQYAFMEKGRSMSVMLPYCERLAGFSSWYRQCWAESLGKGGKGTTPIRALGATDQHSQLQLYLDGPKDKLFHLITLKRAGTGQPIHAPDLPGLDYLQGKTTGDVMEAEQRATLMTLTRHHCPVRHFELPELKEEHMGALLMHFMLEIIFMAKLLDVNPFDQPAVEQGKLLARDYLRGKTL
jgi:glucose-6-phosphate isomerase